MTPGLAWEHAALGAIVRRFPHGGNALEAACREALRLGFAAGRIFTPDTPVPASTGAPHPPQETPSHD